jgi:TRAP-type C4-dicarboxylate transport system substrate-binding protein
MQPEVQQQFDDLFEVFTQDGWQTFQKDVQGILNQLEEGAVNDCTTNDQWQFRRGQITTLQYIVNYSDGVHNNHDNILKEEVIQIEEEDEQVVAF